MKYSIKSLNAETLFFNSPQISSSWISGLQTNPAGLDHENKNPQEFEDVQADFGIPSVRVVFVDARISHTNTEQHWNFVSSV